MSAAFAGASENMTGKEVLFMWKLLKRLKDAVSSAVREIAADEEGVGVVEIILILVVLISLVVIFKKQVTQIVKDILSKAASDAKGI
jgi:Flp pilus assembly pilin Flp